MRSFSAVPHKPAVLVSMPLVWGVRNVFRSGLREELDEEFRLVFAVPPEGRDSLLGEGIAAEDIWVLPRLPETRRHSWSLDLLRGAHSRRHPTGSDGLFGAWRLRNASPRYRVRHLTLRTVGRALAGPLAYPLLRRTERDLFRRRARGSFRELLGEVPIVAGLSTSCVVEWERPLFEAMQSIGIPTIAHVLSFDNLTSRGYIPLEAYDRFLVWNEAMASELLRFYQIERSRITVTGTPQFDFHVAPEFQGSREDTVARLGLDKNRPYLVYCANHHALTPTEPALVAALLARAAADPVLEQFQWVIRLHPMDRYARWATVRAQQTDVRWDIPWQHDDGMAFWAVPKVDEVATLGNTLRFAGAVLNVASTVALDAAVVDTPIVGVGCHPSADAAEARFYRDVHWSHHYRPISESGAAPVGETLSEVMDLLLEAVTDRGLRRDARKRLVRSTCGAVDGSCASRIAAALRSAASGYTPRRSGAGAAG